MVPWWSYISPPKDRVVLFPFQMTVSWLINWLNWGWSDHHVSDNLWWSSANQLTWLMDVFCVATDVNYKLHSLKSRIDTQNCYFQKNYKEIYFPRSPHFGALQPLVFGGVPLRKTSTNPFQQLNPTQLRGDEYPVSTTDPDYLEVCEVGPLMSKHAIQIHSKKSKTFMSS